MATLNALTRNLVRDARTRPAGQTSDKRQAEDGQTTEHASHFYIMITGQLECGEFAGRDNLYCRYTFSFGNDWQIAHGLDAGLSQIARKVNGYDQRVVWNFPIDLTFKTTNAFGWPRIAISVFCVDAVGRDTIVGYGSVLIPTVSGVYERTVHMYAPQTSSVLQRIRSWIAGAYPEFFDSKFVARSEGREVTRVRRTGTVRVTLSVTGRDIVAFGYNRTQPSSLSRIGDS